MLAKTGTIEDATRKLRELPQVDLNEQHLFADGMYCRQVSMPAGSLIVGHVHKKEAIKVSL